MKTFTQIRETLQEKVYSKGEISPELFGDKGKFLAAAKKFKSTVDIGGRGFDMMSPGIENWTYETQGTIPPDLEWHMDKRKSFNKNLKDTLKLKKYGLTHIFCFHDPKESGNGYFDTFIHTVRFSGKNDKIAQGLKDFYKTVNDPDIVYGSDPEDYDYGGGSMFGSLALGEDKPSKGGNKFISKFGTQKAAGLEKLDWKTIGSDGESKTQQIAIIQV